MPDKTNDTIIAAVLEQLVAEGPQAMAQVETLADEPSHADGVPAVSGRRPL